MKESCPLLSIPNHAKWNISPFNLRCQWRNVPAAGLVLTFPSTSPPLEDSQVYGKVRSLALRKEPIKQNLKVKWQMANTHSKYCWSLEKGESPWQLDNQRDLLEEVGFVSSNSSQRVGTVCKVLELEMPKGKSWAWWARVTEELGDRDC